MIIKDILEYWPFLGFCVAVIAGYTELRVKSKSNASDIKSLDERFQDQRREDNQRRKEENQRYEDMLREIRGDIKTLVHRGME